MNPGRSTWREHYMAARQALAARRKPRNVAGLNRENARRRAIRVRLLNELRRERDRCIRLHAYADQDNAPLLCALGSLAMHYGARSVTFHGVRFRVTFSAWRGAVRDPETGDELVLFSWSR